MKKAFFSFLLLCLAFPLTMTSCKKEDAKIEPRVYFTYRVGYYQSGTSEQCISGDGLCDFEVRKKSWRPESTMPDGYGFGYLTVTSKLKLQMVVYLPFLPTDTYRQHYEDGFASLPGPWRVAAEITTKLGLIDGYSVSMGDYKVSLGQEDGYDVLIITF
jgi:hypothetical protein